MTTDKKKSIIDKYNASSQSYDARYNIIQREKFEFVLNQFNFSKKLVLDAGCGTGLLYDFISINKSKQRAQFLSLDISWGMLIELKNKQRLVKKKVFILPILSDIEHMPIRNNIFDAIVSFTSFQNLSKIKKGFLEVVRVSKPRAEIILSILKKDKRINLFISFIKPFFSEFRKLNNKNLEDIIIYGILLKD
ncbi:MAG: class I SAM-dependent methyltransferase [Promethearchaeota archaeon]|nr:MAG: class I SAM-dependent methyltransferase [Candidatus Lokiarchaeota archaeon]